MFKGLRYAPPFVDHSVDGTGNGSRVVVTRKCDVATDQGTSHISSSFHPVGEVLNHSGGISAGFPTQHQQRKRCRAHDPVIAFTVRNLQPYVQRAVTQRRSHSDGSDEGLGFLLHFVFSVFLPDWKRFYKDRDSVLI